MKRALSILTAWAVFLCLTAIPVLAQHGGGHAGGPPAGGAGGGAGMGMGGSENQGRGGDMGRNQPNTHMGKSGETESSVSHSSPTSLLSTNTKLSSTLQKRLGSMLPSGMSLSDAANGFKNLGQFIAAVHVSHNLGVPFTDLKDKVTSGDSLGKAIHTLKPSVDAKVEAQKGDREAKADLKESNR